MKKNNIVFSKNLRAYMDKHGKTQKDIAKAIGVSSPTVHDWMYGNIFPRMAKIEALASYFGISKSDLIEERPILPTLSPKEVGAELQKILVEHGISPPELDERAEIKAGTTAKILAGKYEPHIDVAIKIATVLDIPASLLLGVQEDAQAISRQRFRTRLYHEIPDLILNDDEITEIINYIKYLISKRK